MAENTSVAIACDHAAYDLRQLIIDKNPHINWVDLGTQNFNSVDYPDYAHALAKALKNNEAQYGILLCGSGIGISIAANRHKHIRAALCHDERTARLSRQHNDANVLVMGARIIESEVALSCVEQFLNTEFEGGRHQKRIDKINP